MANRIFHHNRVLLIALLIFGANLLGCQSLQSKTPGELALKNHDFIGLWDAYNQCLSGTTTREIQGNLYALQAAPKPISLDDSPVPMPRFIKNLSSVRRSRLAVDPRAMAASCSIHLAAIASTTADWDTALQTLQAMKDDYPEPQYAYYVSKATEAIKEFSSVQPVSLSSRSSLSY